MAVLSIPVAVPAALRNLPPFPPVAAKLVNMLAQDDVSFGKVAHVFSTDAALTAEVLRLANSPLGGRFGASTILQALSLLGIARVSSLVMTLSVSKFLKRAGKSDVVRRCWRHNLACAIAAKEFAVTFDVDLDQAYTAGLLHDVGRLALLTINATEYEKIVRTENNVREAEQRFFGIDHCAAGGWLLQEWKLPVVFAEVAAGHHEPMNDQSPLTNLIHVACTVAHQLGFSPSGEAPADQEPVVSDELSYTIATGVNAIECEFGL